jgi:branched-chain amino acid transport system ATP-binding protein
LAAWNHGKREFRAFVPHRDKVLTSRTPKPEACMALLTATDVRHNFGGLRAIDQFNLELHEGEPHGFDRAQWRRQDHGVQPDTGVYRASAGSIRLRTTNSWAARRTNITALRIARTFQNIRLFRDLSVLDNVRIAHFSQTQYSPTGVAAAQRPSSAGGTTHHAALARVAGHLQARAPRRRKCEQPAVWFQRRLEIARALATGPELSAA